MSNRLFALHLAVTAALTALALPEYAILVLGLVIAVNGQHTVNANRQKERGPTVAAQHPKRPAETPPAASADRKTAREAIKDARTAEHQNHGRRKDR